jgi:hypothetical protein
VEDCGVEDCGVEDCGVVVDVSGGGVAGEFGVLGLGLTSPEGPGPGLLVGGAVVEPAAPLVVSLPAEGLGAEVEALALAPVAAPDDKSIDARLLGDAVR